MATTKGDTETTETAMAPGNSHTIQPHQDPEDVDQKVNETTKEMAKLMKQLEEMVAKVDTLRGSITSLERKNHIQGKHLQQVHKENRELKSKLADLEKRVTVVSNSSNAALC